MKKHSRLSKKSQIRKWKRGLKDTWYKVPRNVHSGQSITNKMRQEDKPGCYQIKRSAMIQPNTNGSHSSAHR